MATVSEPLPAIAAKGGTGGLQRVVEAEEQTALECLARHSTSRYYVCRLTTPAQLTPEFREQHAAQLVLPQVGFNDLDISGIVIGEYIDECCNIHQYERRMALGIWKPQLTLSLLTELPIDEVEGAVLKHGRAKLASLCTTVWKDPEAWRNPHSRGRRTLPPAALATGEPLAFDVILGPLLGAPTRMEEGIPLQAGFKIKVDFNVEIVARSTGTAELVQQLEKTLGDVTVTSEHGVTCLHLAALSGSVPLAKAVAQHALVITNGASRAYQLDDGRSPLHLAALFNDPELVEALLPACDPHAATSVGCTVSCTALQMAQDLQHLLAAAVLQGHPQALQDLCRAHLRAQLRKVADPAIIESGMSMLSGEQLGQVLPLYEYRALSNLATALPGSVPPSMLLRSMSCMECWYAELFPKAGPVLAPDMELIPVWDELESFRGPPSTDGEEEVAVLAEAFGERSPPSVADRDTFLERFHRRTGGVLKDLDWSNLLVIGGMVLACLTADDEDYAANFAETDVDIYVVGTGLAEGSCFHTRVCEVIESLPESDAQGDHRIYLSSSHLNPHDGDPGIEYVVDKKRQCLVITGLTKAAADFCSKRPNELAVGDLILAVGRHTSLKDMQKALAKRKLQEPGRPRFSAAPAEPPKPSYEGKSFLVRPARSLDLPVQGNIVRTTSTLTACLRKGTGEALPNIQVVLAPYVSKAHLLFNTDIDCTALGFDGQNLYATPRAREALLHRRNIARPEKYAIRGEWRTDARLLKYAGRGFRVVDLGLKPNVCAQPDSTVEAAAAEAARLLKPDTDASKEDVENCRTQVRSSGVHGARLLLLASHHEGLRQLLLHEAPMLPAGTLREEIVELVTGEGNTLNEDDEPDLEENGAEIAKRRNLILYNDGYGGALAQLLLVNPVKREGTLAGDGRLRGREIRLEEAVTALDLEAERFQVRGWYEGMREEDLRQDYVTFDPREWRGLGPARESGGD